MEKGHAAHNKHMCNLKEKMPKINIKNYEYKFPMTMSFNEAINGFCSEYPFLSFSNNSVITETTHKKYANNGSNNNTNGS